MSAVPPIGAAAPAPLQEIIAGLGSAPAAQAPQSFGSLLAQAVHSMETKVANADQMVKAFALNDSIPVHQVTYALEQARLAVELAMQVRARLLEGYRELMNMQL
jgi:flagellar hook-basal body complex protein FliE